MRRADCCTALGAELRSRQPADWRPLLAHSSCPRLSPRAYLGVRLLLALFMDGVLLGSATLSAAHPGKWCIYLTHWTLLVVAFHLTLGAWATWAAQRSLARGDDPPSSRPWWLPILWSAQAIALPGSLLVFVLFWALVYPGWPESSQYPINYFVHGANFAAMGLDCALSRAPYLFVYLWSSWFVYGVVYVLFSVFYFLAGGTNEGGDPWIYAVLYWGSASGAASAGVLVGLIVFALVPALGLLSYWLVFLRRSCQFQAEGTAWPWAPPACAPPPSGVPQLLLPRLHAHRGLRWLPLGSVAMLGATFSCTLPLTLTSPAAHYWRDRVRLNAAVVPYISDTGVDQPSWFVFAAGLSGGALLLLLALRLLYEGMDPLLQQADQRGGIFVFDGDEERAQQECEEVPAAGEQGAPTAVPQLMERFSAAPVSAQHQPPPPPQPQPQPGCCCHAARWRHCCCCCAQGLRQQGHSAYVCGSMACLGLPVLGWCSAGLQIAIHSFGAAATFLCIYIHMCLLARIQAARLALGRQHGEAALGLLPGDASSARFKAALAISVIPAATAALFVTLLASGSDASAVWNGWLAPLVEWAYAGLMALYVLSLCHELSALHALGQQAHEEPRTPHVPIPSIER